MNHTATPVAPPHGRAPVSRDEWLVQRRALLAREKQLTALGDELAAARRALPWVRVDTRYVFEGAEGPCTLADLFEGRRQLLVQHFMLGEGWGEGCPSCSYMADHLDGMVPHLAQRDVALAVVARAPFAEVAAFRRRMGWRFRFVSSHGSPFNGDFGVGFSAEAVAAGAVDYNYQRQAFPATEAPGISVFARGEGGEVFHTYSTYGRGVEVMMGTYRLLDLTPRGRDEAALAHPMAWVRHHDRYEPAPARQASACGCG